MKRLAVVGCLIALCLPAAAQAHRYNHTMPGLEAKFETKLLKYRVNHGGIWLLNAVNLHAATVALNSYHYKKAKWGTRINGVPWAYGWNAPFLGPTGSLANALMITRHCHGEPYKPKSAVRRLMSHKYYRTVFMLPAMRNMGLRVTATHRHVGAYKGRGRCIQYYLAISS